MISFNEIKSLCKEHDECLKKNRIINNANKEQIWIEARDAKGNSFMLDDDEIDNLNKYIAEKGLNIETKVQRMVNPQNSPEYLNRKGEKSK